MAKMVISNRCDGSCETTAGCLCWMGVQVPRKLTEADLDRHRADMQMPSDPVSDQSLARMLSDGTISGPYRATEPVTVTWRMRLARWWRRHVVG